MSCTGSRFSAPSLCDARGFALFAYSLLVRPGPFSFGGDEIERLRREAAVAFSLEVDLKAEKRINDELRKEVHS